MDRLRTKTLLGLGVVAWLLVLLRFTNVPIWSQWRNEQLLHAVQSRNVKSVTFWLEAGANANVGVYADYHPLNLLGQPPTFSTLPEENRLIDPQPLLFTALNAAPRGERTAVISVLLDHGADKNCALSSPIRATFAVRALYQSVEESDAELLRVLLQHGVSPNAKLPARSALPQPLFSAIENGNYSVLRLLLRCGAKQDPDCFGATPLQRAAENNDVKAMQLLLEHGAKVDECDQAGKTALMYAVRDNQNGGYALSWTPDVQKDAIRLLLAHGANINAADTNNKTVLMYAALRPCKVSQLLLSRGANPAACDRDQKTSLHYALDETLNYRWNTNTKMVRLFQKYGASLKAKDKNGKTPEGLLNNNQKQKTAWDNGQKGSR